STPRTSLPNDCVRIARPCGPARVRATTPVSRPPAPARAPSTMPLPPQKLRPHCVPLRPRRRPRRHAHPVPSRLAATSTPRARPLLTPRCCCALSPCAARPVPSHPTLAAFRGSPLTLSVPRQRPSHDSPDYHHHRLQVAGRRPFLLSRCVYLPHYDFHRRRG
ncbi:hypothetical protein B0H13DRAFT_1196532, partial [Mycena leptocephala]